jgi:hypothetical protein
MCKKNYYYWIWTNDIRNYWLEISYDVLQLRIQKIQQSCYFLLRIKLGLLSSKYSSHCRNGLTITLFSILSYNFPIIVNCIINQLIYINRVKNKISTRTRATLCICIYVLFDTITHATPQLVLSGLQCIENGTHCTAKLLVK